MPKNKGKGGKKHKRGKKGEDDTRTAPLLLKEDGQEYGLVTKMLGGGRVEVACNDGKTRQAKIRGAMMKKVWIRQGDCVLLGLRDFQDDKADVIHKYSQDDYRHLKKLDEISAHLEQRLGAGREAYPDETKANVEDEDCAFDFEEI